MRDDTKIALAKPPETYDQRSMGQLVRQIQDALNFVISVGPARFQTVNIEELPTSATGLRPGDLWRDGSNNVKVVV